MIFSSKFQLLFVYTLFTYSLNVHAIQDDISGHHHKIQLSSEEQNWIEQNPLIRVAPDPQFPPFESRDANGKFSGISIDYLKLLENRTGLKFEFIKAENWSAILASFRQGKIDVIPAIAKTPQREKYMAFITPHIVVPGVIITSKEYTSIKQLSGHRVAVVVDQVWDELISHRYVDVNLVRVKTQRDGIELASMGAVDAMVTDLASVTYILKKESISNLRIVKYLEQKLELGFAVQKEQPILKSILQKGISSLNKKEKSEIQNKWISIQQPSIWLNKKFWFGIIFVLIVVFVSFGVIIFWNFSLRKRVEIRTRELQTTQLQLIQAEKMDSIGRLALGLAHEIKNPLAIIQMGIEFLAEEIKINKNNKEVLDDVNNAIERADHIISSFLDYSSEDKLNLDQRNINQAISRAVELLAHQLHSNNIDCELRLSQDIEKTLLDENKLIQVFVNLLMNSMESLLDEEVKQITIESRKAVLSSNDILDLFPSNLFQAGDEAVIVRISDTGCGIVDLSSDKLLEPFFTTKKVGDGTGLGLPVSLKIIQLHHGAISIKNRQKCGTVVTIVFRFDSKGEE